MLIKFLFAILTFFITGYIILKFINFKKENIPETIGLSFGLGAGFIGISMFFLSLCGMPFMINSVILPQLVLLFLYLRRFKINSLWTINKKISFYFKWNFSFFESILLIFIIFEIFYVLLKAGSMPFVAWDAWGTWGFKAKALFIDRYFSYREWINHPNTPHMNYPLLLPFQEAYIYIFLNRIHEPFIRVFCSLYFIGLIFLFYGSLIKEFSRKLALLICFFLSTMPILSENSVSGYADIPLAFYISLSIINLWNYIRNEEKIRLWLGCIFFGFAMWVKNEGTSFWIAIFLSLVLVMLMVPEVFKYRIKIILKNTFIPWLIFSPWVIFRLILNIKNEFPLPPINKLIYMLFERLFLILRALVFEISKINKWNIFWIVFLLLTLITVIVTILFRNKIVKIRLFFLYVIFFQSLFFMGAYIFSASNLTEMIQWTRESLHRPLLQFYPIALFFIAQCIGILEKNNET